MSEGRGLKSEVRSPKAEILPAKHAKGAKGMNSREKGKRGGRLAREVRNPKSEVGSRRSVPKSKV